MARGIILFGGMGVGDTTLGKAVAGALGWPHIDLDDYIWMWDTPLPFTKTRPRDEKIAMLREAISHHPHFVMSGSMFSFRKEFEPCFDMAVFLTASREARAERIRSRELRRWGARVLPGGDMYEAAGSIHRDYMECVRSYDEGPEELFSRAQHEKWIGELPCPVLRLDGERPVQENVNRVIGAYGSICGKRD
ncbi:MAG: shikimate kinase [Clostridia bacterium]|nr:shikimate kinase [Clostridia bacterium]